MAAPTQPVPPAAPESSPAPIPPRTPAPTLPALPGRRKSELEELCRRLELIPSRRLGQNFLLDGNLLGLIVRLAAPAPGEQVLEVGPGTGLLSSALLGAGANVLAVEYDARLAAYLRERFGSEPRFRLVQGDAVRQDYDALLGTTPYSMAANLPYSSGTAILAQVLAAQNRPTRLVVMLQLEMAERLAALPGTRAYGALSVRIQVLYEVRLARRVPPTVFWPQPEVGSALVTLTARPTPPTPAQLKMLDQVLPCGFTHRRKQFLPQLRALAGPHDATALLASWGHPSTCRAEELSPAQHLALATWLLEQRANSVS